MGIEVNPAAKAVAHAIVCVALATAQGQNAAAIGGAVYGMKGVMEKPAGVDIAKPSKPTAGRTPEPNRTAADEDVSGWSQYDQYRNGKDGWNWLAKLGFAEKPVKTALPVGTRLDRFCKTNDSLMAPHGTPYEQCALTHRTLFEPCHEYFVIKSLPVMQGKIVPTLGKPVEVFKPCLTCRNK